MRISRELLGSIIEHARAESPREACGILAGGDDAIVHVYRATNVATDPEHRWEIAAAEQWEIRAEADDWGWQIVGTYHSHPLTAAYPSDVDLRFAQDTGGLMMIIGFADSGEPQLGLWRAGEGPEITLVTCWRSAQ